jgi:hypothetical protein
MAERQSRKGIQPRNRHPPACLPRETRSLFHWGPGDPDATVVIPAEAGIQSVVYVW